MKQEVEANAAGLSDEKQVGTRGHLRYSLQFRHGGDSAGIRGHTRRDRQADEAEPGSQAEGGGAYGGTTGVPSANQALSDKRAQAVGAWLTTHGVEAARLTAKGFGQDKPIADNSTEDGRAKNRRVELAKM